MVRNYVKGLPGKHRYRPFTRAELVFIRRWAGVLSYQIMGRIMGRSPNAVNGKALELGLPTNAAVERFIEEQQAALEALSDRIDDFEREEAMAA